MRNVKPLWMKKIKIFNLGLLKMFKRRRQKFRDINSDKYIGLETNDLENKDMQNYTMLTRQLSNDTVLDEHCNIPSINTTSAFIPNIPCNEIDLNETKPIKFSISNDLESFKLTVDSEKCKIPHTSWVIKIKGTNIINVTLNKKLIKENIMHNYNPCGDNHVEYKSNTSIVTLKENISDSILIHNNIKNNSVEKKTNEDEIHKQDILSPYTQITSDIEKYFIQKFTTVVQSLHYICQDTFTISLQLKNILDMIYQKISQNKETFHNITDLHSKLQDAHGDIEDLKLQNSDLIKQDQINRESLKFLTTENIRLMEQHNLHNLSIIQIKASIQQAISKIEACDLPSIKRDMQQIISVATRELEKKNIELDNANKNLQEITKLNIDLTAKLDTQMVEIKNNFQNNITKLSDEIATLKKENEKLITEKSLLETKHKKAVDDIKDIKDDLCLKTEYIKDLEQTINDLQISNKYYRDELIKSDTALQDLKNDKLMPNLNVEIQKIHQKYDKEITELKNIIENLRVNNR